MVILFSNLNIQLATFQNYNFVSFRFFELLNYFYQIYGPVHQWPPYRSIY